MERENRIYLGKLWWYIQYGFWSLYPVSQDVVEMI